MPIDDTFKLLTAVKALNLAPNGDEAFDGDRVLEKALDGNIKGFCYFLDGVNAGQAVEGTRQALRLDSHSSCQMEVFPALLMA